MVPWRVRFAIRRLIRRARHAGRDFEVGERSERSSDLARRWADQWPGIPPFAGQQRGRNTYQDRWVRFHSLPESKRYADDESEYQEILRRHRTVLRELTVDDEPLLLVATDWDADVAQGGWTKALLPEAWPWLRSQEAGADPDDPWDYLWVAARRIDELDPILRSIADDCGQLLIAPMSLEWLYAPYDGGADVYARSSGERNALREHHREWLSSHPRGL